METKLSPVNVEKFTKKEKKWQPTAIYKCSQCGEEKHIRSALAPIEMLCLRCDRRVRPKIMRARLL
jgi:DNA-directed RNA polymerase subunit RPC12/RpoP